MNAGISNGIGSQLWTVPDFLPKTLFYTLRGSVERNLHGERINIPLHKRGSTISYELLNCLTPAVCAFYRSAQFHDTISELVGTRVHPTPLRDQSSCSILIYDRRGDG